MKEKDWKKLELLKKGDIGYERLLDMTALEDEHPEWYNGACMCCMCRSYGAC